MAHDQLRFDHLNSIHSHSDDDQQLLMASSDPPYIIETYVPELAAAADKVPAA